MSLSLEDTSFAKYYKKFGREKGRDEVMVEFARKMLEEGIQPQLLQKSQASQFKK